MVDFLLGDLLFQATAPLVDEVGVLRMGQLLLLDTVPDQVDAMRCMTLKSEPAR